MEKIERDPFVFTKSTSNQLNNTWSYRIDYTTECRAIVVSDAVTDNTVTISLFEDEELENVFVYRTSFVFVVYNNKDIKLHIMNVSTQSVISKILHGMESWDVDCIDVRYVYSSFSTSHSLRYKVALRKEEECMFIDHEGHQSTHHIDDLFRIGLTIDSFIVVLNDGSYSIVTQDSSWKNEFTYFQRNLHDKQLKDIAFNTYATKVCLVYHSSKDEVLFVFDRCGDRYQFKGFANHPFPKGDREYVYSNDKLLLIDRWSHSISNSLFHHFYDSFTIHSPFDLDAITVQSDRQHEYQLESVYYNTDDDMIHAWVDVYDAKRIVWYSDLFSIF